MSETLVSLMEQTINEQYALERQGRFWSVPSYQQVTVRSVDRHAFAFSLDCPGDEKHKPLAFFNARPPPGISRMCDAIMACHHEQRRYLFLIEIKTRDKGRYKEQLNNGKLFCDWLLRLYKAHGHLNTPPTLVGLLIWFPSKSLAKEGTSHKTEIGIDEENIKGFNYGFEIKNQKEIPMLELFRKINRS